MGWVFEEGLPDPNDPERARTRALRCLPQEVAPIVLLPGDPARARMISDHYLDDGKLVMANREFHTYSGTYRGQAVSVISTGLGSPGAAMVVRDLGLLGVKAAIRVGTAGAGNSKVSPGDLVIASGAVRDEGVTRHYAPVSYPAVPDPMILRALEKGCLRTDFQNYHIGVVHTSDAFQSPITARELPTLMEMNVLAYEMEAASVFVIGAMCNVATGCILAIDGRVDNVQDGDTVPDFTARDQAVDAMVKVSLEALEMVGARNRRP